MAVARHASTRMSKRQRSRSHGYENRYGRMAPRRGTARRLTAYCDFSFKSGLFCFTAAVCPT